VTLSDILRAVGDGEEKPKSEIKQDGFRTVAQKEGAFDSERGNFRSYPQGSLRFTPTCCATPAAMPWRTRASIPEHLSGPSLDQFNDALRSAGAGTVQERAQPIARRPHAAGKTALRLFGRIPSGTERPAGDP
jgi:hypothetical protein